MNDSFIGGEMMIVRTGDLNPNRFGQGHSWMESLKQAMLQHELIFRNQVRELHRLYWTQKNLMNELHRKWFDAHAPSNLSRVAYAKCKGSTEEKSEFSESSCVRENLASLEQFKGRPAEDVSNHAINLHLPAVEFIRGTCADLPYGHTDMEVSKINAIVDGAEEDKVGFGLVEVIDEKGMPRSASMYSCKEVIDLEASFDCREANEVFFGFSAPIQKGKGMLGSQPTSSPDQVSSSTVGNDMHHVPSMFQFDEGHDGRLEGQKPSISFAGLGDSCVATLVDHSRIIQQAKPVLIDLNVPLEDECSHDLNNPAENTNLKFGSSVLHDGILEHDQSNLDHASFIPKPASSNYVTNATCDNQAYSLSCHDLDSKPFSSLESEPTLDTVKDKGDTENIFGTKVMTSCHVQVEYCGKHVDGSLKEVSFSSIYLRKQRKKDADFSSGKLPSAAHSDNKMQDSNITSSNSTNLPQTVIRVNKQGSHEGSEEDTLSSHAISQDDSQRHAPSRKFPTGCNSVGITRKNMCGPPDQIVKEPAVLSNTDDSEITQLNISQNDGSSMEKLMPVEEDLVIAAAADVLMGFSTEVYAIPTDHQSVDVKLLEVDCDKRKNQPLHSSDSFESMTLQLSEVQTENHLNISLPRNLTESAKNVNGHRLRRGRGLRDFQKEILPGIASLARHEICEDLHTIGHKLRRTASRNARESCFVPVKGRRSRLYSGRRRN